MKGVRFVAVKLHYGCHTSGFEFADGNRPFVIWGSNGSGKSSLLEGLVRTLFGFNRQKREDQRIRETRRPWIGEEFRGRVRLCPLDGSEHWIGRDFDSASVEILDAEGRKVWAGDGNPGATNQEATEYRRRLRAMFGLAELAEYERTGCAQQGELAKTHLGDKLLQAAAGGQIGIDEAMAAISSKHRALTRGPIVDGGNQAWKERELERLKAKIDESDERLKAVQQAEQERRPLVEKESRLTDKIRELDERVGRLEDAFEKVSRLEGHESEKRRIESRIHLAGQAPRQAGESAGGRGFGTKELPASQG